MAAGDRFIEAAGRSLGDAQGALAGASADVPRAMAISEAQLEVKAAIDNGDEGMAIRPVGTDLLTRGGIDPGLVSTVTLRFVPVAGAEAPARRTGAEVMEEVRKRDDVRRLEKILGALRFEAQFLPDRRAWVVTATDPAGAKVREVLVADDA